MIALRITFIVLVAAMALAGSVAQATGEDRRRAIVASYIGPAFVVARSMPVTVEYQNNSEEAWSLYQPDRFTGTSIRAVSDNPYHARLGMSMAPIRVHRSALPDGSELIEYFADAPPRITIEPHETYSFQRDLNSRFRSALRPGRWTLTVTDRMQKLSSAPVRFAIVVTRESIDRCVERSRDESLTGYQRNWHAGFLLEVRPDLPLEVSGRVRNLPREEQKRILARNEQAKQEFAAWWKEHRDTPEVEEILEQINAQAGVLEEYRRLRDEQQDAREADSAHERPPLQAVARAAQEAAGARAELQQALMSWREGLSLSIENKTQIETDLMASFLRAWEAKVRSLKEFGGRRDEREVEFSPLERKLLELLRDARTALPLFTETSRPRRERLWEYLVFLRPHLPMAEGRVHPENLKRWQPLDRRPYQEVIDDLKDWLDEEVASKVTPEMIHSQQRLARALYLFMRLRSEVERRHRLRAIGAERRRRAEQLLANVVVAAQKRLEELGLLEAADAAPPEALAELSDIERALYEYFRAALRHNPIFEDLDNQYLRSRELQALYDPHVEAGRPPAEQKAYEAAVRALEVHAGLVDADEAAAVAPRTPPSTADSEAHASAPLPATDRSLRPTTLPNPAGGPTAAPAEASDVAQSVGKEGRTDWRTIALVASILACIASAAGLYWSLLRCQGAAES